MEKTPDEHDNGESEAHGGKRTHGHTGLKRTLEEAELIDASDLFADELSALLADTEQALSLQRGRDTLSKQLSEIFPIILPNQMGMQILYLLLLLNKILILLANGLLNEYFLLSFLSLITNFYNNLSSM